MEVVGIDIGFGFTKTFNGKRSVIEIMLVKDYVSFIPGAVMREMIKRSKEPILWGTVNMLVERCVHLSTENS